MHFLSACLTMKESDNSTNYGSIMIPKARGVRKSLFRVSTSKEREAMNISLPYVGRVIHHRFSLSYVFTFAQLIYLFYSTLIKGLKNKTYPAMDLPVNGESDGESCTLVEDCIRKL